MIDAVSLQRFRASVGDTVSAAAPTQRTRFASALQGAVETQKGVSAGSLEDIFAEAAEKYGVPVNLLKAIGKTESNFNASAVSSCGAQGIMQLMPATARSLGVSDALDARQNIMGGAKYISQMLNRYDGDAKLALAAYNAGSGNVQKYGGVPPFKETQNYVTKVMNLAGGTVTASGAYTPKVDSNNPSSGGANDALADFTYSMDDYALFLQTMLMELQSNTLTSSNRTGLRVGELPEDAN